MLAYLATNLSLIAGPTHAQPGEELRFRIRAENTGYARWIRGSDSGTDKGSVHLVAHVLSENEEPVFWYHAGSVSEWGRKPG